MEENETSFNYDYNKDSLNMTIKLESKENKISVKAIDNQNFFVEYESDFSLEAFKGQNKHFEQFSNCQELLSFLKQCLIKNDVSLKKEEAGLILKVDLNGKNNQKEMLVLNLKKVSLIKEQEEEKFQIIFKYLGKIMEKDKIINELKLENSNLKNDIKLKDLEINMLKDENKKIKDAEIKEMKELKDKIIKLNKELDQLKINEINNQNISNNSNSTNNTNNINNTTSLNEDEINKNLSELVEIQKFLVFQQYGQNGLLNYRLISDISNNDDNKGKIINIIGNNLQTLLNFKFKSGTNINLSEDYLTAAKIRNDAYYSVIGDKSLIKNKVNRWKIKITKSHSSGGGVLIGIVPSNIDLNSPNNYKKAWYIYDSNSYVYTPRSCISYGNCKRIKEGDVVEVIVDLIKGHLSFGINDTNLGIANDNIPLDIDFVPFVELFYQGQDEVKIINY